MGSNNFNAVGPDYTTSVGNVLITSPIPEPGVISLLVGGLMLFLLISTRKKRQLLSCCVASPAHN